MVNFPSVAWVPLVHPNNSYDMVIFSKGTSVAQVPQVLPMNNYYMVLFSSVPGYPWGNL